MTTAFERFIRDAQRQRGAFFDDARPITVARAPAWVDLLGGAAPHAGSLALGWPLGDSSFVALQPDPAPAIQLRVWDTGPRGHGDAGRFVASDRLPLSPPPPVPPSPSLPLSALTRADGEPHDYAVIADRVARLPQPAPLVAAAYAALLREEFVRFPGGARVLLHLADAPGAEASLVAAVAQALVSAYGAHLAPRELGLSLRAAMARTLGPARDPGDLGALVAVCAPAGALLLLHQQPAWLWGNLHLPHGSAIWALRAVPGPRADASLALGAAAMALRIAAEAEGLSDLQAARRWRGYPANLGTAALAGTLGDQLPATARGDAFLARYGPIDGVAIDPATAYPVRAAAALAVEEHLRARTAAALLRAAASKAQRDEDLALVGELLAQSHAAQRAAGYADPHADALAERIHAAGPAVGLFGARAPAAASGASLVVLGRSDAEPALRAIVAQHSADTGVPVTIHGGSASGCSPAGTREI